MNPKTATADDLAIGQRIATLRKARGLTQTALGRVAGVTFQQIQKYENGTNRISGGRLHRLASFLEVELSTLFDEAGSQDVAFALLTEKGATELLRAYTAIESEQLRRDVLASVRIVARMGVGRPLKRG